MGTFGGAGWVWAFLIIALIFNGGNMFGGGNKDCASQADVTNGFNNNATQTKLDQISLSSANNNYETAKLINDQTLLNVQGYNQVSTNLLTYTNSLQSQIAELGYHMDSCCCELKTQMLQDKYEAAQQTIQQQANDISNANQTQYILNTLGRFYTYPAVNPYTCYNGTCSF